MENQDKKYAKDDIKDIINESVTFLWAKMKQESHNKPSEYTLKMFNDVNKKLDCIHSALFGVEGSGGIVRQVDEIVVQTKKTNGSIIGLRLWRSYITGAIAVIVVLGLPIMWSMINDVNQLKNNQATALNIKK